MTKRKRQEGYISNFYQLPDLDNYEFKPCAPIIIQQKVLTLPKVTSINIENNFNDFLIKNGEIILVDDMKVIYLKGDYYYYDKTKPEVLKFQTENDAFNYALSLYKK